MNNMKLQDYLEKHNKLQSMNNKIDEWSLNYQFEKLVPLIEAGYDFQDIVDFFAVKFSDFVHNGNLDEILKERKTEGVK